MAEATMRPGTLDDVEFLCQAMYSAGTPLDPEAEAAWFEGTRQDVANHVQGKEPNSTTYVIESGGERVGRMRVVRTAERILLAGIQLPPGYRGKGFGTAVIGQLLQEARERGLPLELTVSEHNPDAERLYLRLGFRRIGIEDGDHLMAVR